MKAFDAKYKHSLLTQGWIIVNWVEFWPFLNSSVNRPIGTTSALIGVAVIVQPGSSSDETHLFAHVEVISSQNLHCLGRCL